jgi:hypothetical protein
MASTEFLRTLISQNELMIMRLRTSDKPYAQAAIDVLQRDIDRWKKDIEARHSTERMREQT